MNYSIFEAYNYLQDVICVMDPLTLDVLWVNKAGYDRFGDYAKKKCYEYIYIQNTPCDSCDLLDSKCNNGNSKFEAYTHKKVFVKINGKEYLIVTIYDTDKLIIELNNNAVAKSLYEIMLSGMTDVDLQDSLQDQVYKTLRVLKKVFKASRVSIVKNDDEAGLFPMSVKKDIVKDFYYNPILKKIIYNDDFYKEAIIKDHFVEIYYNDIVQKYPKAASVLREEEIDNLTLMMLNIDGEKYFLVIENCSITLRDRTVYTVIYNYLVFALKSFLYNKTLYQMSNKDILTNISNRYKYEKDIALLDEQKPSNFGVLFLDLDRLKKINDTFGHHMGDRLIITTANILTDCFSFAEVYRMGGDEFVVLAKECDKFTFDSAVLKMKNMFDENSVLCSYGYLYEQEFDSILDMISTAESQMYYFKRKHHEKYHEDNDESYLNFGR